MRGGWIYILAISGYDVLRKMLHFGNVITYSKANQRVNKPYHSPYTNSLHSCINKVQFDETSLKW